MIHKLARTLSIVAMLLFAHAAPAQGKPAQDKPAQPETPPKAAAKSPSVKLPPPSATSGQQLNFQAYAKLLQADVRSEKSEIMSEVMQFDAEQNAKFWPIYRDYDAELTKLDDIRIANIEAYTQSYAQMTDEKADQLIRDAMTYQKTTWRMLAKYYERVKSDMGAITAARFVQVEHQLLLIIDLQIASKLPVVRS